MLFLLALSPLWAAAPPTSPKWADGLVEQLGDDDFNTREAAAKALDKAGGDAVPALRRGLQSPDAEIRSRSLKIAKSIEKRTAAYFEALGLSVQRPGGRGRVEVVSCSQRDTSKLRDEHLSKLVGFPWLVNLDLYKANISDAGLHRLGALTHLEYLGLDETRITDRGLIWLSDLSRLETLNLSHTSISGTGLARMHGLLSLKELNISHTKVDAQTFQLAVESLVRMEKLNRVSMQSIGIHNQSLNCLYKIRRPLRVDLSDNRQITDEGVAYLSKNEFIVGLGLVKTSITDQACKFLKQMPKLETVGLGTTKVTMSGMIELRESSSIRHIGYLDLKLSEEQLEELKRSLPDRIGFNVFSYGRLSK
jgi:hypothetical protein